MKVLVCGGRNFTDSKRVFETLDAYEKIDEIIHGGARGADTLAGDWAQHNGVEETRVLAQWTKYGNRAGPIRNREMLGLNPDLVIAFAGGKGTADMVRIAKAAGIPTIEISPQQEAK